MVVLQLCGGFQIEQCGGTTKAPPGQGRQDGGEKLNNGFEWHGFSLSLSLSAEPGSFLHFPLGFGRLGFFMFVFESHMSDMCLFL